MDDDFASREGGRAKFGDSSESEVIEFDVFRIECATRRLTESGQRIRIQQKPLDVLVHLARHHSRVVPREELLARFWPRAVHEEALTRCISTIRRLLHDTREPPRFIETQWGRGYRFIGQVNSSNPGVETVTGRHSAGPAWLSWPALAAAALLLVIVAVGLRDSGRPPFHTPIRALAVLPIAAGADTDEWLVEALTDHLVQTVSRIEGLTVMARGSAGQFSATSDPQQIGARLGVDAALVTHLERRGELTGLRAQLVSTRDGSVLWNFSVPPRPVGVDDELVRELARSVARRLWATLQIREPERSVDSRAYQLYLRGRYYWNQRSAISLAAAVQAFEAALAIEPGYADAFLGLADSWLVMGQYTGISPHEAMPKARASAERALELDPSAAHALAVLGVIAMQYDWDWTTAEDQLRRALTLNPNDATAEQWLGELYCYRMHVERCRKHLLAASGLDPLSPVLRMMQGSPDLFSGDFEMAVKSYARAVEDVPEFPFANYFLGLGYAGLGEWDRAIASYESSLPNLGLAIVGGPMIYALARRGDTARAESLLAELENQANSQYVPPTKLATAWLGMDDRRRAFEWLERALDARDDRLVYLAVDAHFFELHGDAAFQSLADRIGVLDGLQSWRSGLQPESDLSSHPAEEADGGVRAN